MKNAVFWLCGVAFFAYQALVLARLVAERREDLAPDARRERDVEMVWTLVPAALVAALALMLAGLTDGAWSQSRTGGAPLVGPREIRLDGP